MKVAALASLLTAVIAYLAWDAVWTREQIRELRQQIERSAADSAATNSETLKTARISHDLLDSRIDILNRDIYVEGFHPKDIRRRIGELQGLPELRRLFEESFDRRLREFSTWQYGVNEKLKKLR